MTNATLNFRDLRPLHDALSGTGVGTYLLDDDVITVDHADQTLYVGHVHLVADEVNGGLFDADVISQVDAGVLLFSFPLAYLPSQLRQLGRIVAREPLGTQATLKTA